MKKTTGISVPVRLLDVLYAIEDYFEIDEKELLEFIIRIDKAQQDWGFTLKLWKHFDSLKKKYDALP